MNTGLDFFITCTLSVLTLGLYPCYKTYKHIHECSRLVDEVRECNRLNEISRNKITIALNELKYGTSNTGHQMNK